MAWTTPKTWVDQETVSADDFNTQIRDNLDSIAGHTHTGTAGDGSATLDSLDYIDLDQQGALSAPATGHTRFAANTDGTLRYYANGGSEKTVADTTHTHTQSEGSTSTDEASGSQTLNAAYGVAAQALSLTKTPSDSTGTAQYGMFISACMKTQAHVSTTVTLSMKIDIAGSTVKETSHVLTAGSGYDIHQITHFEIAGANTSTTYEFDFKGSPGGYANQNDYTSMTVTEIRCL